MKELTAGMKMLLDNDMPLEAMRFYRAWNRDSSGLGATVQEAQEMFEEYKASKVSIDLAHQELINFINYKADSSIKRKLIAFANKLFNQACEAEKKISLT